MCVCVCVCVCIYIYPTFSLSIYLLIDIDCFHILAIINNAIVKLQVCISFRVNMFGFLDIYTVMELLGYIVALCLVF